jgi:hypothetical protein
LVAATAHQEDEEEADKLRCASSAVDPFLTCFRNEPDRDQGGTVTIGKVGVRAGQEIAGQRPWFARDFHASVVFTPSILADINLREASKRWASER